MHLSCTQETSEHEGCCGGVLTRVFNVRYSRKRQNKKSASPSPLPPTVESSGEQTGNKLSVRSENHRRDNS
ncbi:unnamed protein product, partial [Brassica rapa subsp. narinosa]